MDNPFIEEKLVKETNSLLSEEVPIPNYENTKKFQYTHATFYETLRLYPSVPNNFKVIIKIFNINYYYRFVLKTTYFRMVHQFMLVR